VKKEGRPVLKTRIKNYAILSAVVLIASVFLTLRACTCGELETGCAEVSILEMLNLCVFSSWKSLLWDTVAVVGAVWVFRWFKGSSNLKSRAKDKTGDLKVEGKETEGEPTEEAGAETPPAP